MFGQNDKLEFDLDKMKAFKGKVVELRTELSNEKKQLKNDLVKLKKDWQTPAGKKFFEKDLGNWEERVDVYVTLLTALDEMMEKAIEEYSDVRQQAGGNNIYC